MSCLWSVMNRSTSETRSASEHSTYVALEHIESWTGRHIPSLAEVEPESTTKRFGPDDVLFCKLRPYLAKVWLADAPGFCTTEMLVLRAKDGLLPAYLAYALRARPFIEYVNSSTFGARMPRADWTFMGSIPFLLPPLDEQQAIVTVLDQRLTSPTFVTQYLRRLKCQRSGNRLAHGTGPPICSVRAMRTPRELARFKS